MTVFPEPVGAVTTTESSKKKQKKKWQVNIFFTPPKDAQQNVPQEFV